VIPEESKRYEFPAKATATRLVFLKHISPMAMRRKLIKLMTMYSVYELCKL
jgi:hypothetical protein